MKLKLNKYHYGTYAIAGITTIVWLLQVALSGGDGANPITLFNFGALWGQDILAHPTHIWRLFTAMFVHVGWEHWFMNVFSIIFIGRQIEAIWGTRRYVEVYLLSGVMGNALSFFVSRDVLSAGASTSIFGVFAAIAILGYLTNDFQIKRIGQTFAALIVINLLLNAFDSGVNMWGHIGGAIGGLLLAAVLSPKFAEKRISSQTRTTCLIVYVVALVLFVGLPFFN
jgi:membrane associated rhomboid family serine protease